MDDLTEALEEIGISQLQQLDNCLPGHKYLMLAILEDAIKCYLTGDTRTSLEAERWFQSTSRSLIFSFEIICECFDLDAESVRQTLKKMKKEGDIYNRNRSHDWAGKFPLQVNRRKIRKKRPGR